MKILYVTTIGMTMRFFEEFIKELIEKGHSVDIATNENISKVPELYRDLGCNIYNISCTRSPINKGTFSAIKEIRKIVSDNSYDIVHCHTPIAAMCARVACRKLRKKGLRVIYTAHGFHFFKGAPLKNWLLYYPIEKICSYFTDVLITINNEDYTLAKRKMKAKSIKYVPGVGINVEKFSNAAVNVDRKRSEIGIPTNAIFLLSVGEINNNKNHQIVIRALSRIDDVNIHYVIAGKGDQTALLKDLAINLNIADKVHFIGYRDDIAEICKVADIYVLPSIREGLNVSLMEAMASGLPCVAGNIRGNNDLIDENGGVLFDPMDISSCVEAIKSVLIGDRSNMGAYNSEKAKKYGLECILRQMKEIYN